MARVLDGKDHSRFARGSGHMDNGTKCPACKGTGMDYVV
jgi:hypothetical protein